MRLVMNVYHFYHFADRCDIQKWMTTLNLKFFIVQSGDPRNGIGAHFFILRKNFKWREIFAPCLLCSIVSVDRKIGGSTLPTQTDLLEQFDQPSLGSYQVGEHV